MRAQRCSSPSLFSWRLRIFLSHLKNSHQPWSGSTRRPCGVASGVGEPHHPGALPKSPALSSIHGERQEGHPHLFLPLPQVLQEEGLDLGVQMEAIRPLIHGNPNHQQKMGQLSAHCQALQRSLEVRGQRRARAAPATGPCHLTLPEPFSSFLPSFLPTLPSSLPHSFSG